MTEPRKIPEGLINDIAGDLHESLDVLRAPLGSLGSQCFIVYQTIEKIIYRVLFAVDAKELDEALEVVEGAEPPEGKPIDVCNPVSPFD